MDFPAIISKVCPKAKPDIVKAFSKAGEVLPAFAIASPLRLAHFLAQVFHESGRLTRWEENLRYSAERLTQVWPRRFPTLESALPYAGNPEALAEKVYGGRMGNVNPGDGFAYHGRGLIQVTGRDIYARVGDALDLPLVDVPSLACHPDHALAIACQVWRMKDCNAPADMDDIEDVTRRINGGLNGLEDRAKLLASIKGLLS